jgi:NTE family protein
MIKRLFCLFIAVAQISYFVLQPSPLCAQAVRNNANPERPKIGLVLGGGGARGVAHAGVLKVLEENRIPIDYIAGTSMGAIVGGLYAAGYSPAEIETICKDLDWDALLTDRPPEKYLPFRDKGETRRLMKIKFGMKNGKLSLPQGLIAGQNLGFKLKELFLHVSDVDHFDKLNIPFRCVSTDIETGGEVVFENGDLAEAVRASMAVPGAFAPVMKDGRILVDGMVVKNVPVDVAQKLGADVIIAVNVGVPLLKKEEIDDLMDITGQMFNLLFEANVKQQLSLLKEGDILIHPDLGQNSTGDFSKAYENLQIGEKTARAQQEEFARYSVSPEAYQEYVAQQRRDPAEELKIDFIEAKTDGKVPLQRLGKRLPDVENHTIDMQTLKESLTKLYALGTFKWVNFRVKEKDGKKGIVVEGEEKTWDRHSLRLGLNLEDDFDGHALYKVALDDTIREINGLGAEWQNTAALGNVQAFRSQFYQPLDYADTFFVQSEFMAIRREYGMYNDNASFKKFYRGTELMGQVDTGINIGTVAQATIGLNKGIFDGRPFIDDGENERDTIDKAAFVAKLQYNTIDNFNFPTEGSVAMIRYQAEHEVLSAAESYNKIDTRLGRAFTFSKAHTIIPMVEGGTYIGDDPTYDGYQLGGFLNLSGYRSDRLGGYHYGLSKLIYLYKLQDLPFKRGIYLGGSLEYGNVWQDRDDFAVEDMLFGGSAFLGIDTLIGPLYFGYGLAEENTEDHGEIYLYLGQRF